jgi:multidrug transporter EmrE-like cation transporter
MRKTTTSCARGHNDDSYSRFSRAPSPRLSLSACKVFCVGKFEFYCECFTSFFSRVRLLHVSRAYVLYHRIGITLILILARVTLRARTTNLLVMGSCCRGGIVNIRCLCTSALVERPDSSKALWLFRASTSNSLSGRTWPPTYTHLCHIHHTYAQQDIRVYEDDHLKLPKRQYQNPTALWILRVSI